MARSGEPNETAELYEQVWRADTYAGFSRGTAGAASTPLLDAFVREVKALATSPTGSPRVVELGAGSCVHARRCALAGLDTVAVEYSASAVASAKELDHPLLTIEQADLFTFTHGLSAGTLAGVYANAVFHFLSGAQRAEQYALLRAALVEGGLVAISFKAQGDALEKRGRVVEATEAGPIVEGDDGIRRLFVTNAETLAKEMGAAGLSISEVFRWSVPDYNVAQENGEFVGLLARRST